MDKKELRKLITKKKKEATPTARLDLSGPILRRLATHPRFVEAHTVLMYHSLPDEVDTQDFVRYWSLKKNILLPTVSKGEIELRRFAPGDQLEEGVFGVQESTGEVFTDYASIDLAVVPGVAFDAEGNRLGRGKGFYDRFLARLDDTGVYKLGICFDFQKVDCVPVEAHDVAMDEIL